jgi:hypothetical protein
MRVRVATFNVAASTPSHRPSPARVDPGSPRQDQTVAILRRPEGAGAGRS